MNRFEELRDWPDGTARRVLVVASELPPGPGGIGAHGYAVATELHRQGRDVEVLGCQDYCEPPERDAFNAASIVRVTALSTGLGPLRTALERLGQIRSAIDRFEPDVVIGSGQRILWLLSSASARRQVPLVAVAHGTDLGGPRWAQLLTRRSLRTARTVVAVSEFTAGLVRDLGITEPAEVIHNGADGDRFNPDATAAEAFRARYDLGQGPVILTVGSVSERKGQHLVVEALPEVLETCPDTTYALVGRPHEAAAIKDQARRLGVAHHVRILGQLGDDAAVDAHRAADVFAMTSTRTASGDVEGYGIAVAEAALCGVPAVVTSGSGVHEAVVDGETGVVVAPDAGAVAAGLIALLGDDDRRRTLGDHAHDRARASGTWRSRVMRYGEILDQAVAGEKPRMVVVSHTAHYRTPEGATVGFGPTLRELDHLATLTSELVHVAPLYPGPPPGMVLPITARNIRHVPVPPAGGPRQVDRLVAMAAVPRWAWTINREMRRADVIHVRAPAGIAMVALLVLRLRRTPKDRWVKYAGNWSPDAPDAITYRLQRAWLRRGLARAAVTVNGAWPDQPAWIHAFDNPTLTEDELHTGAIAAQRRPSGPPFRAVFVGRLEHEKGADQAVQVVEELRTRRVDLRIDLIGDGPLRPWVEQRMAGRSDDAIVLHGWLTRPELEQHLAAAHLMLLPTASEGFPKVLGESLAFGCVPVTTAVSSIGQVLGETGGAVLLDRDVPWADAIANLLNGGQLSTLAGQGTAAADRWSYRTYLERVRDLATTEWGRML